MNWLPLENMTLLAFVNWLFLLEAALLISQEP
jgi:hypothetical protein